jgi:hypothetical protein
MSIRASGGAAALLLAAGIWATPTTGAAQQYQSQCTSQAQCPAGTVCMNGACVRQQAQQPQQTGYAQPTYQQQPSQQPTYQQQPRVETRRMIGLIVAGGITLGASWVGNILVSAFAGVGSVDEELWEPFRGYGLIPVVGPWVQLATKPTPYDQDSWGGWLIGNGLLQAGGLTMLILGIAIPVETTVYSEGGPGEGLEMALLPQLGSTNGLQLVGHF